MKNNLDKKLIFIIFSSLLFSCSQRKNNLDFDLSNLPKPKNLNIADKDKENKNIIKPLDKAFIKDLVPFKDRQKLLSEFKFGKKDPFSESEFQVNKLSSDFKLTGLLNTKVKKYVFVNYLGNEGTISEKSIGGVNTNLLPKGAKVINIDLKAKSLTINYENENFKFEL